jgi:hypothetical protein
MPSNGWFVVCRMHKSVETRAGVVTHRGVTWSEWHADPAEALAAFLEHQQRHWDTCALVPAVAPPSRPPAPP